MGESAEYTKEHGIAYRPHVDGLVLKRCFNIRIGVGEKIGKWVMQFHPCKEKYCKGGGQKYAPPVFLFLSDPLTEGYGWYVMHIDHFS
jgi:hypothetical protein